MSKKYFSHRETIYYPHGTGRHMLDEKLIKQVVEEVLLKVQAGQMSTACAPAQALIPINSSNRHVHIMRDHLDILFGSCFELTKLRDLVQPGEFASNELVTLVGPGGIIQKVRILGPLRGYTQVEISLTDSFALGIKSPPVRDSAQHEGSPGVTIVGPKGSFTLSQGVILAQRHIHMHTSDGEKFGFKNGDWAKVRVEGARAVVFEKVLVRVKSNYVLEMHIDIDEANACGLRPGDFGRIIP